MLIRDKIGENIKNAIDKNEKVKFEVVSLENDEDFFESIVQKIKDEVELLHITKSVDCLAEIVELVDWLSISLGTTHLEDVIEHRKEKLGLYWKRYYIKDFDER